MLSESCMGLCGLSSVSTDAQRILTLGCEWSAWDAMRYGYPGWWPWLLGLVPGSAWKQSTSSSTPCSISPTTTALDRPERRTISSTIAESSLSLGLELSSWVRLLRWDPGADPECIPSPAAPGGALLLQSSERQKF